MAVTRTERPGPARFVLPILGLIGLGLCIAGVLVLYDPKGGPNLLASIYEALGNTRAPSTCAMARATNSSPSSCWRSSPWRSVSVGSGCCSSASERW